MEVGRKLLLKGLSPEFAGGFCCVSVLTGWKIGFASVGKPASS
jgi:hypothetical protein